MSEESHINWLNKLFSDFKENNLAVADCDEVQYFITWVNENKNILNGEKK